MATIPLTAPISPAPNHPVYNWREETDEMIVSMNYSSTSPMINIPFNQVPSRATVAPTPASKRNAVAPSNFELTFRGGTTAATTALPFRSEEMEKDTMDEDEYGFDALMQRTTALSQTTPTTNVNTTNRSSHFEIPTTSLVEKSRQLRSNSRMRRSTSRENVRNRPATKTPKAPKSASTPYTLRSSSSRSSSPAESVERKRAIKDRLQTLNHGAFNSKMNDEDGEKNKKKQKQTSRSTETSTNASASDVRQLHNTAASLVVNPNLDSINQYEALIQLNDEISNCFLCITQKYVIGHTGLYPIFKAFSTDLQLRFDEEYEQCILEVVEFYKFFEELSYKCNVILPPLDEHKIENHFTLHNGSPAAIRHKVTKLLYVQALSLMQGANVKIVCADGSIKHVTDINRNKLALATTSQLRSWLTMDVLSTRRSTRNYVKELDEHGNTAANGMLVQNEADPESNPFNIPRHAMPPSAALFTSILSHGTTVKKVTL